jgi:hypothetical protein
VIHLFILPLSRSEAIATFEGHNGGIRAVISDGIKVVTGSRDGDARLWDFATGISTGQFNHGG